MKLEELFLTKEELPILYETCFQIPIHPRLLKEDLTKYESLAQDIFPQVAEEWKQDLTKYLDEHEIENKEWIKENFLNKKMPITKGTFNQTLNGMWVDDVCYMDNGLVYGFSISRNGGGSIYFSKEQMNCEATFPNRYILFSKEKVEEFRNSQVGEFSRGFVYAPHNVDYFPGALFLRNWAMKYMNEIFKKIF